MADPPIDPRVRIGHVHLKVADMERALGFYRDVLGFEVTQRMGDRAAFLAAPGPPESPDSSGSPGSPDSPANRYHHHIGLNTWTSKGGSPPPLNGGHTGLFHVAIVYPTRAALADALRRLMKAGVPLTGAADHGVSEALYLDDPDGNGVELYWDRPRDRWPHDAAGQLAMFSGHLDLDDLLREGATEERT